MDNISENDVGIWVDEAWGVIIGHALFIESLSSDNFPRHASIKWHEPDKTRLRDNNGEMPLYYGQVQQPGRQFHLFGVGEAASGVFHNKHVLSDLQFPVEIKGAVVIIENGPVEQRTEAARAVKWYLKWVRQHAFPFVIAATGYLTADEFRRRFAIEPSIPVIPGPSMRAAETGGSAFDAQHAKRVLEVLVERIEAGRLSH